MKPCVAPYYPVCLMLHFLLLFFFFFFCDFQNLVPPGGGTKSLRGNPDSGKKKITHPLAVWIKKNRDESRGGDAAVYHVCDTEVSLTSSTKSVMHKLVLRILLVGCGCHSKVKTQDKR